MTYTQLAVVGVVFAALVDGVVLRTHLLRRRVFWVSYAIIVPFQLFTNAILTGSRTVRYAGDAIIGSSTPAAARPPLLGDGRLFYAPIEDILFGFSLILLTLTGWVWLGRRGVQREPVSSGAGRPFERFLSARRGQSTSDESGT